MKFLIALMLVPTAALAGITSVQIRAAYAPILWKYVDSYDGKSHFLRKYNLMPYKSKVQIFRKGKKELKIAYGRFPDSHQLCAAAEKALHYSEEKPFFAVFEDVLILIESPDSELSCEGFKELLKRNRSLDIDCENVLSASSIPGDMSKSLAKRLSDLPRRIVSIGRKMKKGAATEDFFIFDTEKEAQDAAVFLHECNKNYGWQFYYLKKGSILCELSGTRYSAVFEDIKRLRGLGFHDVFVRDNSFREADND